MVERARETRKEVEHMAEAGGRFGFRAVGLTLAVFVCWLVAPVAYGCVAGDVSAEKPPHIVAVLPGPGARVGVADLAEGIWVSFHFRAGAGMGQAPAERVRMVVNGRDVTGMLEWRITEDIPPSAGGAGYRPRAVPPGRWEATVTYYDAADVKWSYRWSFEVARGFTVEESGKVAQKFLDSSRLFRGAGVPGSIRRMRVETLRSAWTWAFVFEYETTSSGHGPQEGEVTLPVVTTHRLTIVVQEGRVVSAMCCERWDMLADEGRR